MGCERAINSLTALLQCDEFAHQPTVNYHAKPITMLSIRRTLTGYLFVLLAVTLAVVWIVIDQVMARTLAAQEAAGVEFINARYDERCREELARVDKALLDQARLLGTLMHNQYRDRISEEWAKNRATNGVVALAFGPSPFSGGPLALAAWTATGNTWMAPHNRSTNVRDYKFNPHPGLLSRLYFANLPIPADILHKSAVETDQGYFQINTQTGREWRSESLGVRKLPFSLQEIDAQMANSGDASASANVVDWTIGSAKIESTNEMVRRVVYKMPHITPGSLPGFGGPRSRGNPPGGGREDRKDDRPPAGERPMGFGAPIIAGVGTQPRGTFGAWIVAAGLPTWPQAPNNPPPNSTNSFPRLYIQCAYPQSSVDQANARFAEERDEEISRQKSDLQETRRTIGREVAAIGALAFMAVAVGAPLLVGRGLRPVGKLSDAVSRVSEKDFKLPHDGHDLAYELVPIHARLTQTLDLLQRAFAREKQAVADISHELRTPIAALLATIDVALRKPRTFEQYRTALEECRLISKQLGQLVERIMTLASLDAGNDRTLVSRTDAAELASGCIAVIRPLAAAYGITVELQTEEPLELDTDGGKLREVLMNLLHNAVEYNKPEGTIQLSCSRKSDSIVFEVSDTGIGMDEGVREKIFERFFRADQSRHSTGVHAGLGLAIVKEYILRLGGTIRVDSEPGDGSTFTVTLPATSAAESASDIEADTPISANA